MIPTVRYVTAIMDTRNIDATSIMSGPNALTTLDDLSGLRDQKQDMIRKKNRNNRTTLPMSIPPCFIVNTVSELLLLDINYITPSNISYNILNYKENLIQHRFNLSIADNDSVTYAANIPLHNK